MLIKSSGHLEGGLFLLTLGDSCHYVLTGLLSLPTSSKGIPASEALRRTALSATPFVIFDPGTSAHVEHLLLRLERLGLSLKNLHFILPTHLHPERVSGIPLLKSHAPHAIVVGTQGMRERLADPRCQSEIAAFDRQMRTSLQMPPLSLTSSDCERPLVVEECLSDSEVIGIGDETTVRISFTPGHSPCSVSYLLSPHDYLLGDETLGYYRGRENPAPAPDHDIHAYRQSLERIGKLKLRALCLPFGGMLTGGLVTKHLHGVSSALSELERLRNQSAAQVMPQIDLERLIQEQMFSLQTSDVALQAALRRTISGVTERSVLSDS